MTRTDQPTTATGDVPSTPTTPPAGKQRDAWLDNVRFILLGFVLVDHFSPTLQGASHTVVVLLYWVHFFHMPAFVMVTGYFSRSLVVDDARARGLVTRVLVPYFIFQTLYQLIDGWIHDRTLVTWEPLTPHWLMWFLIAMVVWRLMTPYLLRIRWIFPISIAVSLGSPAVGGVTHLLSIDRVLQMLPYFVFGLLVTREHLQVLKRLPVRIAAGAVLVAAWPVADVLTSHISVHWMYFSGSYAALGSGSWRGAAIHAGLLAMAFVTSAAVLSLTPPGKNWMSALGKGSLYGYLLHGFVAWGFAYSSVHTWFESKTGLVLWVIGCFVLTAVLCSPLVQKVFRPIVEPPTDWLLRRRDADVRTA